jgi:hypothetical protein
MKSLHMIVFVIVVLLFYILAVYSQSHVQTGYSQGEIAKLDQMCADAYKPVTLQQKQAKALAEIYGITAEEVARPVDLFRERR